MKNTYLLSLVVATILFTGCGDTSSSATDVQPETSSTTEGSVIETSSSTTFTVERGPILGATLADANGTAAREIGNGQYVFDQAVEYPVVSTGGYIDVNRNGTIDAGEVENTLHLETTEGNVVTLATTLSSNADIKTFLVDDLGIDEVAIANSVPGNDQTIEALSDTVFKYAVENDINNTSELSQEDLAHIQDEYTARYDIYLQDGLEAAEHETDLINSMSIVTLDDAEALAAETEISDRSTSNESATDAHDQTESTDSVTAHSETDGADQTDATASSENETAHSETGDTEQMDANESDDDETSDTDATTSTDSI